MSHTIIVGAGLAGISVAFELRETLGNDHPITLISPEAYVQFVRSNPWVAAGWRKRDEVTAPLGKQLVKKKIDLVRAPEATGTWNAICLADMGDTGIAIVALPQLPPRNVTWAKKGKWVHLAKIGFEKYFLGKVRKGITTTVYENFILKQLGITKLKKT